MIKYLGLWTGDFYDLTKGHIDPGETPYQAAIRETREESGITSVKFHEGAGVYIDDDLVMFLAKTEQEPKIKPNPQTGKLEHEKADWLTYEELTSQIKPSLLPAIIWANDIILNKTIY